MSFQNVEKECISYGLNLFSYFWKSQKYITIYKNLEELKSRIGLYTVFRLNLFISTYTVPV